MSTIEGVTLPPELLLEVFSHLEDGGQVDQQSLKNSTLVCRAWADPAQSVLWQSGAVLEGDKDVKKFIGTASRRRVGAKEISVYGLRNVKLLEKLWDSIAGVENLTIVCEGGSISAKTFNHPALSDLKSLGLRGTLAPFDPIIRLPFQLTRLNVADEGIRTRHLASFLSTIAKSSTSTLRSLSLLSVSRPSHSEVSTAILPFAPNLRHIGLTISSGDAPPYVAVFEAATSLKSFECTSLPLSLLHSLPTSLVGFATGEDERSIDLDQLKLGLLRLPRLERLYFTCSREGFGRLQGGNEFVAEMEKKGVVWNFAEDY
ncbi:F-box protein [Sporobolomyces salmoneus]|uniref:F-box protein n=1 Tax=Sporobolomyces salmoneus TaxID=183962 RepID=UPI00316C24FF